VALAGQPNCGKSTVFNALTGASQHVANYPGVTVEKMYGGYRKNGTKVSVVDLPGTYSLTSYSMEERVSRDFILRDKPSVVVNVMDASNLKRHLYLTFQLLEMEVPLVLNLNMMDVAKRRGVEINFDRLAELLGVPVAPTVIKKGKGKKNLLNTISEVGLSEKNKGAFRIDYGVMEPFLEEIEKMLADTDAPGYPLRWLAVKLMEADGEVEKIVRQSGADAVVTAVKLKRRAFEDKFDELPEQHIAYARYKAADIIADESVVVKNRESTTWSDKIDKVVCHKIAGPLVLVGVVYALYHLSIVEGYKLTNYTWPLLAWLKSAVSTLLPDPAFVTEPLIRSLALWFVDSVNALLNYIPIFFILFALIAILEDTGYMPRMAFLLDRLFKRFGLHGQSTLPMVLGGVFVGGCAVPAIMSTKGIPDERARFATTLIIPMLNCLAKIPLYILMINIYFATHKGVAMMFMATITLLMALPVAKILSMTILKDRETAPFIMEMPPYHLPTFRGVLGRAVERIWLFLKKIVTIVAAVAIVIFVLMQFPGLSNDSKTRYAREAEKTRTVFNQKIKGNPYAEYVRGDNIMPLILYADRYKKARMGIKDKKKAQAVDARFIAENEVFFKVIKPKRDKDAKKVKKAFKKMVSARKKILREIKAEKIDNSFLGKIGRSLEPVTKWAGFNWRVNVALLSSFAAKESSVATLGAIYQSDEEGATLEQRMAETEKDFTPLHALSLLLVMALFPPCIAAVLTIKIQTGSTKWMLFSMFYQMLLGIMVASIVFTGGRLLGLSGLQAMAAFFGVALTFTIVMGLVNPRHEY
jgi:ferrous iron transport protein B